MVDDGLKFRVREDGLKMVEDKMRPMRPRRPMEIEKR